MKVSAPQPTMCQPSLNIPQTVNILSQGNLSNVQASQVLHIKGSNAAVQNSHMMPMTNLAQGAGNQTEHRSDMNVFSIPSTVFQGAILQQGVSQNQFILQGQQLNLAGMNTLQANQLTQVVNGSSSGAGNVGQTAQPQLQAVQLMQTRPGGPVYLQRAPVHIQSQPTGQNVVLGSLPTFPANNLTAVQSQQQSAIQTNNPVFIANGQTLQQVNFSQTLGNSMNNASHVPTSSHAGFLQGSHNDGQILGGLTGVNVGNQINNVNILTSQAQVINVISTTGNTTSNSSQPVGGVTVKFGSHYLTLSNTAQPQLIANAQLPSTQTTMKPSGMPAVAAASSQSVMENTSIGGNRHGVAFSRNQVVQIAHQNPAAFVQASPQLSQSQRTNNSNFVALTPQLTPQNIQQLLKQHPQISELLKRKADKTNARMMEQQQATIGNILSGAGIANVQQLQAQPGSAAQTPHLKGQQIPVQVGDSIQNLGLYQARVKSSTQGQQVPLFTPNIISPCQQILSVSSEPAKSNYTDLSQLQQINMNQLLRMAMNSNQSAMHQAGGSSRQNVSIGNIRTVQKTNISGTSTNVQQTHLAPKILNLGMANPTISAKTKTTVDIQRPGKMDMEQLHALTQVVLQQEQMRLNRPQNVLPQLLPKTQPEESALSQCLSHDDNRLSSGQTSLSRIPASVDKLSASKYTNSAASNVTSIALTHSNGNALFTLQNSSRPVNVSANGFELPRSVKPNTGKMVPVGSYTESVVISDDDSPVREERRFGKSPAGSCVSDDQQIVRPRSRASHGAGIGKTIVSTFQHFDHDIVCPGIYI